MLKFFITLALLLSLFPGCDPQNVRDVILGADEGRAACQAENNCVPCMEGEEDACAEGFVCALNVCLADTDGDLVLDIVDNCPQQHNASQGALDDDREGDLCDNDIDNDGIANDRDHWRACEEHDTTIFVIPDDGVLDVDELILVETFAGYCGIQGNIEISNISDDDENLFLIREKLNDLTSHIKQIRGDFIYTNNSVDWSIQFDELRLVRDVDISANTGLSLIRFPHLISAANVDFNWHYGNGPGDEIITNERLTLVSFPSLMNASMLRFSNNPVLEEASAPVLERLGLINIHSNDSLRRSSFPALRTVRDSFNIFLNPRLEDIHFPALQFVNESMYLDTNGLVRHIEFPRLEEVGDPRWDSPEQDETVTAFGGIYLVNMPALRFVSMPALRRIYATSYWWFANFPYTLYMDKVDQLLVPDVGEYTEEMSISREGPANELIAAQRRINFLNQLINPDEEETLMFGNLGNGLDPNNELISRIGHLRVVNNAPEE